eukprot:3076914-Rhodomonas_salina.3
MMRHCPPLINSRHFTDHSIDKTSTQAGNISHCPTQIRGIIIVRIDPTDARYLACGSARLHQMRSRPRR